MNQARNQAQIKYVNWIRPEIRPELSMSCSWGCLSLTQPQMNDSQVLFMWGALKSHFQRYRHIFFSRFRIWPQPELKQFQGMFQFGLASQALTPTRMKEIQEILSSGSKKSLNFFLAAQSFPIAKYLDMGNDPVQLSILYTYYEHWSFPIKHFIYLLWALVLSN